MKKELFFILLSLSEIPVREFVKARKLARPVSPAEFETDPDEWTRLAAENKNLRQLDAGKKIIQREDDFYDRSLTSVSSAELSENTPGATSVFGKSP